MRKTTTALALAVALVMAGCGDDSVLDDPASTTTAGATTTEGTAPATTATTESPGTSTTLPPTTVTEPPAVACEAAGGIFVAEEGAGGVCFAADAITAEEYVIRKVDLDDADGGLRVWSGPGAPGSKVPQEGKYVETGVIPPYAGGVTATGHATPDDLWYYVQYGGFEGWARSAFLSPAGSATPLPACLTGGDAPIPAGAAGLTEITGNFDGRAGVDTFSVYWNGSEWMAHIRTTYGYHSEMPTGHTGMAPGVGPEVYAAFGYDFEADGQDEAWVYDDSPVAGEIWSTFAFFNNGCTITHVTHQTTGMPQYWVVGQTVTHVDSMSCYVNGVAHYNGAANGVDTYEGEAQEHWYSYDDGVAAEWVVIDGIVWNTADGDVIPNGFECP